MRISSHRADTGFTLIEVLVVASITVMMTGLLVANFSRTRVDLNQTALSVKDAIREAQSMALAGTVWRGASRCGYGIHFTGTVYTIYAGPVSELDPVSGLSKCVEANYGFGASGGTVRQGFLSNATISIVAPNADIFFEPPDPKTYILGSGGAKTTTISVRRNAASCPSVDCRVINVTTSGQIQ